MLNVNLEHVTAETTLLFAEELVVSSCLNFLSKNEQKLLTEQMLIKQAKSVTKLVLAVSTRPPGTLFAPCAVGNICKAARNAMCLGGRCACPSEYYPIDGECCKFHSYHKLSVSSVRHLQQQLYLV